MKLVTYSLVPSSPMQYMHLGYTAAAPQNNASGPMFLAVFFFAIAVLTFKKSQIVALLSVLCMAVCCYCAGLGYDRGVQRVASIVRRMMSSNLSRAIETAANPQEKADGTAVAAKSLQIPNKDSWRHAYRLTQQASENATFYTLVSDGPDGQYGTTDDLYVTQTVVLVALDAKKPQQSESEQSRDKRQRK